MTPVDENLKIRQGSFDNEIGKLAYERLKLMRRVDEIDDMLHQLEGAQVANDLVRKDLDLQDTIAQAQENKSKINY